MAPSWDDLQTVLALVRTGTLSGAAKALDLNYTTVARRIARIETALDAQLFERRPEGYRATEAARRVAHHAATMEDAQHSILREIVGQDTRLSGQLTVTAPQLLIAHVLAPGIGDFRAAHPDVDLLLRATNDLLDLNRREADIALRISRDPGDTLKGLRLTEQDTASFATQDWADRIAEDPEGLIDWIVYEATPKVPKNVLPAFSKNRVAYRVDDMVGMQGLAQAGLGVVRMPMFLGRKSAGLVQVPVLPPQSYMPIWAVAHPDVWPAARLQAFRDWLLPYVKEQKALFLA